MQKKDPQYAKIPTEYLAQQLDQLLQTEEGFAKLKPLIDDFQKDVQGGMFKCGGKMDQAVKKMQGGETVDYTPLVKDGEKLYDENGGI